MKAAHSVEIFSQTDRFFQKGWDKLRSIAKPLSAWAALAVCHRCSVTVDAALEK